MSYFFDGAGGRLELGTAVISQTPMSLGFWMKLPTLIASLSSVVGMSIGQKAAALDRYQMQINLSSTTSATAKNGPQFVVARAGASQSVAVSVNGVTVNPNGWHYVFGSTEVTALPRFAFLDGSGTTPLTAGSGTIGDPLLPDYTMIYGRYASGAVAGTLSSIWIAEACVWNEHLSPREALEVFHGKPAGLVRPHAVTMYLPLRDSLVDLGPHKYTFVATGGKAIPCSDHPPVDQYFPLDDLRFRSFRSHGGVSA